MKGNKAKLRFLGTGTSQGVPIIGCRCETCLSSNPKDKRLRASALVEYGKLRILVDAGPDFRFQMLRAGVSDLDAILLTHNHRDHTGGLDDLRALNYINRRAAEIFCESRVLEELKIEYPYAFEENKYPGAPEWNINIIDERPFCIKEADKEKELVWIHDKGYAHKDRSGNISPGGGNIAKARMPEAPANGEEALIIIPIRGYHDRLPVLGFRFGDIAYITDMSSIEDKELTKLKSLKHLTLNTVGYAPHHSHFSLEEALELAGKIGAEHTWLTHLSHRFPVHEKFCEELQRLRSEKGLQTQILPAYDGLIIE